MEDVTTIKVSCLCRNFHTSFSVPTSSLPLAAVLCHCNKCRHVSGVFFASYAILPSPHDSVTELRKYDTSDNGTRMFCGSCGAHVFGHLKAQDLWLLATGVLEGSADLVRFKAHSWVGDTQDGGLSTWLPKLAGHEMVRYNQGSQPGHLFQPPAPSKSETKPGNGEGTAQLAARCYCGGVQFHITRPNESSKHASSPWPDLLAPHHTASPANPTDVKWWLRTHETKYFAGLCTCASCRLASGFDVAAWAFVPRVNILQDGSGTPLDFAKPMGTLRRYESSKGTYREFCATCGATVFWHSDERPEVIDVSVGLLEAGSGARAEEWLDWCTDRVSFAEDARDKVLVQGLVEGLRAWDEERES